ncbi:MAG: hypothetical protein SCM11_01395 [Bacillota bacterium]|nr:hypothetical protein [Bacillota bacterium]
MDKQALSVDNDGYLVLSLRKSEAARRCFWVQMKINELIINGWPPSKKQL